MHQSLLSLLLSVFAAGVFAQAQPASQDFEPQIGQPGKDVVWAPTPHAVVEKMLDMAQVTARDSVVDLGSGDGRIVIAAAKRGARARGIEYNPDMVKLARRNAARQGVSDKAKFVQADIFKSDLSRASVITIYLQLNLNLRLRPKILELRPGTRVVSHVFTMYQWTPDQTESLDGHAVYLWIVPARVAGVWLLPHGELTLRQDFQRVAGTLKSGGNTLQIADGRLRGDQLSFSAGDAAYSGRVSGSHIKGSVKSGGTTSAWSASMRGANPVSLPEN